MFPLLQTDSLSGIGGVKQQNWREQKHLHVSLVIVTNLLNADIVLCVNKRLRCGIGLGQGHDTGNVLEVILIVHFHLFKESKYENYTNL